MKVVVDLCKIFLKRFLPNLSPAFFNQKERDRAAIENASPDYQRYEYDVHRSLKRLILTRINALGEQDVTAPQQDCPSILCLPTAAAGADASANT
jgi:hypothetical protein